MSGGDGEVLPWLVLGGLAVAEVIDAALWVAGGTLSALSGHSWGDAPLSPLAQLTQVTGGGPALWPHANPRALIALTVVLSLLVLLPLGWVAWRLYDRAARSARERLVEGGKSQAWATRRDLELLVVPPGSGRVVLGQQNAAGRKPGPLLAARPEHAVLVIGPTQSGKSASVATPILLEHCGPAVVTSVKTDLVNLCAGARQARGHVWIFDPTGQSGQVSACWTPLRRALTPTGAVKAASALVNVAGVSGGASDKTWVLAATGLLGPLLHAAAQGDFDMSDVLRWVEDKDMTQPLAVLAGLPNAADLARKIRSVMSDSPRLRDSILFTVRTGLAAFDDPQILARSTHCDWTPGQLLDGDNTLFLVASSTDQARLAPVMLAILDELREEAFAQAAERHHDTGRYVPDGFHRLLWLEDEAANIASDPHKAAFVSTAGGQGITPVTILHDLSQLREVYGPSAGTIASNHIAKLLLPGVSDADTLRYFSDVIGDERLQETSRTIGRDRPTSTISGRSRAVLAHREGRQQAMWSAVLLYGPLPPVRVALRPYFTDPALSGLIGTYQPGGSPPPAPAPDLAPDPVPDEPDEPVEDEPSPAELSREEVQAYVLAGQAERIGTSGGSPVWHHGQFWHRTKAGDTFEPVTDPAQIEALHGNLQRWRTAHGEPAA